MISYPEIDMNIFPEKKAPCFVIQDNSSLSLIDVSKHHDWFMNIKNKRLDIFCKEVFSTHKAELTENNLQVIYSYIQDNLVVRKRTDEEIEKERRNLPLYLQKVHKVPDYDIIEPTFSIIFDAGIYFGELLMKDTNETSWEMERDINMIDYGKPIIINKDLGIRINPFAIFYLMILRIQDGKENKNILLDGYNKTINKFNGKKIDYLKMVEQWSKGE
jgi:hypothetical protein